MTKEWVPAWAEEEEEWTPAWANEPEPEIAANPVRDALLAEKKKRGLDTLGGLDPAEIGKMAPETRLSSGIKDIPYVRAQGVDEPSLRDKVLAWVGPGTQKAIENVEDWNVPDKTLGSITKLISPVRFAEPVPGDAPTVSDVAALVGGQVPPVRKALEEYAGPLVNPLLEKAYGLINKVTPQAGVRKLIRKEKNEDPIRAAALIPARTLAKAWDATADAKNAVLMAASGGVAPAAAIPKMLAEAAFGYSMGKEIAPSFGRIGEAYEEGGLGPALGEVPDALVNAYFAGSMGSKMGHEAGKGIEKSVDHLKNVGDYKDAVRQDTVNKTYEAKRQELAELDVALKDAVNEAAAEGPAAVPAEGINAINEQVRQLVPDAAKKAAALKARRDALQAELEGDGTVPLPKSLGGTEVPLQPRKLTGAEERHIARGKPKFGEARGGGQREGLATPDTMEVIEGEDGKPIRVLKRLRQTADEVRRTLNRWSETDPELPVDKIVVHDSVMEPQFFDNLEPEVKKWVQEQRAAGKTDAEISGKVSVPGLTSPDGMIHILAPRLISLDHLYELGMHEGTHVVAPEVLGAEGAQTPEQARLQGALAARAGGKDALGQEVGLNYPGASPRVLAEEVLAHGQEHAATRRAPGRIDKAVASVRSRLRGNKVLGRFVQDASDAEIRVLLNHAKGILKERPTGKAKTGSSTATVSEIDLVVEAAQRNADAIRKAADTGDTSLIDAVLRNEERRTREQQEAAKGVDEYQTERATAAEEKAHAAAVERLTPEQVLASVLEGRPLPEVPREARPVEAKAGPEPPRGLDEAGEARVRQIEQEAETKAQETARKAQEAEATRKAQAEQEAARKAYAASPEGRTEARMAEAAERNRAAEAAAKAAEAERDRNREALDAAVGGYREATPEEKAHQAELDRRAAVARAEHEKSLAAVDENGALLSNIAQQPLGSPEPRLKETKKKAPGKASPPSKEAVPAAAEPVAPPGPPVSTPNLDRILEPPRGGAPGTRYSRRRPGEYDFVPARVSSKIDDTRVGTWAKGDLVRLGVPLRRQGASHDVDANGVGVFRPKGTSIRIITVYGKDGRLDAAAQLNNRGHIVWTHAEPKRWSPKQSPFWSDTDKLGQALALRDPASPFMRMQKKLAEEGATRRPDDLYSVSGARSVNSRLIPHETAVDVIEGFRGGSTDLIADELGIPKSVVDNGIDDLVAGRYYTAAAHGVIDWTYDALREAYADEHGIDWTHPRAETRDRIVQERRRAQAAGGLQGEPAEGRGSGTPAVGEGRPGGPGKVRFSRRENEAGEDEAGRAPRYSMRGASAQDADRRRLKEAQKMIRGGHDKDVVRKETGWHQGTDNRWRWEGDDSQARLNMDGYRKIPYIDNPRRGDGARLGDVLDHEDAYRSYPELANVRVVNAPRPEGTTMASFNEKTNTITLYPAIDSFEGGPLSALLHEIQHWIQTKEAFARGGNSGTVVNLIPPEDARRIANDAAISIAKHADYNRKNVEAIEEVLKGYEYIGEHFGEIGIKDVPDAVGMGPAAKRRFLSAVEWNKTQSDIRRELADEKRAIATTEKRAEDARTATGKDLENILSQYADTDAYYRRLAGEEEARQTQKRAGLDPNQRRERNPGLDFDNPPEKQIIDMGRGEARYSKRAGEGSPLSRVDRDAVATLWRYQTQTLGKTPEEATKHLSTRLGDWVVDVVAGLRPAKTAPSAATYKTALASMGRSGIYQRLQEAGLAKKAGLRVEPEPMASEPETPIPPMASAQGNLSRSLQRPAGAGAPKNKTIRVDLPGGGVRYFGKMTPEQWVEQNTKGVAPADLAERRAWYGKVRGELIPWLSKHFGEDRAAPMVAAWLAANQQESPAGAMRNVMRALDKLNGFKDVDKKAGLNERGVMAILMGDYGDAALGVKLSDFVDSALARTVRRWMGDDPRGGAPAVIDVHSARDAGFVDDVAYKRLVDLLGEDRVKELGVEKDTLGAPSESQYEWGARFLRDVTDHLNKKGIEGGKWTPDEAQAVGWFGAAEAMGSRPEHPHQIVSKNISQVSADVAPGEGLGFEKRYPDFYMLPYEVQEKITQHFVDKAIPELAKQSNVAVDKATVAPGGWMDYPSTATVQMKVFGSPEGRVRFAEKLRDAAQQQEVYLSRPLASGNRWAADVVLPKDISKDAVRTFYDETRKALGDQADLVQGFSVVDDGVVRMIDPLRNGKGWTAKDYNTIHAALKSAAEVIGERAVARKTRLDFQSVRAGSAEPGRVVDAGSAPGVEGLQGGGLPDHVRLARDVLDEAWDLHAPGKRTRFSRRAQEPWDIPLAPPQVEARVKLLQREEADLVSASHDYEAKKLDREIPETWEGEVTPAARRIDLATSDDQWAAMVRRKGRNLDAAHSQALAMRVERRKAESKEAFEKLQEAKDLGRAERESRGINLQTLIQDDFAKRLSLVAMSRAHINDGTGTARALAARAKIMDAGTEASPDLLVRKLLKELPDVSDENVADLHRLYYESPNEFTNALRTAMKPGWVRKFMEGYKASLLSSIGTHIANFSGNLIEPAARAAESLAAAGIDAAWSKATGKPRERFAGEAAYELRGQLKAIPDAFRKFVDEFSAQIIHQVEPGVNLGAKLEYQTGAIGPGPDFIPFDVGTAVRTPFRALTIADNFFKALGSEAELYKLAYRQARMDGFRGEAADARATHIIENARLGQDARWHEMMEQVHKGMMGRVFQGEPVKLVRTVMEITHKHPLAGLVVPFTRTPAEITRLAWQRSPMGLLGGRSVDTTRQFLRESGGDMLARDAKGVTAGDVSDAWARPMVGTALAAAFSGLAAAGFLTGSGPVDPQEKKTLQATGWQPYSLRIPMGDGKFLYLPFSRFEPISSLMGIVADGFETKDERKTGEKIMGSVAQNYTNKTFWKGLNDVATAVASPDRSAKNIISSTVASAVVPAMLAKTAEAIDPAFREKRSGAGLEGTAEATKRSILRRVPGVSTGEEPIYDPMGEPAERPGTGLTRFALPVQPQTSRAGKELEAYLVQIHEAPSPIPREATIPKPLLPRGGDVDLTGKRIELTDQERAFLAQARRETASSLRKQLDDLKRLPVDVQRQRIKRAFTQGDHLAMQRLWARSKELRERARAEAQR